MGHTLHSRPDIFAGRPAPVQIQHLGLPGTMGAPFMDYLVADEFLVPPAERDHYQEALILMPHCFQSNDDQRPLDLSTPSRRDAGLPDDGFVFCSFNNSLQALDMPELIARDEAHYETLAVELALDSQRLTQIRNKLAQQRLSQPLFQTRPHTRSLEAAYETAFERATRGEAPATFQVPS